MTIKDQADQIVERYIDYADGGPEDSDFTRNRAATLCAIQEVEARIETCHDIEEPLADFEGVGLEHYCPNVLEELTAILNELKSRI